MRTSQAHLVFRCALAVTLSLSSVAHAQIHPFPTSGHYAQGFIPSAATAAAAKSSYDSWKSHYLKNDCGNGYYRVDNGTGNASTFSEGQGYGMVLTAYFGDRAEFDGLWLFAKKNYNSKSLMGWHVTCSGATTSDGGSGSASDGDEDIGFALVVASAQWGGTYLDDANRYLATLKAVDFTTCTQTGRNVVTAGSWQGNAACTTSGGGSNTSYWMPAYYRVFKAVTGDAFWGKTADDIVTLYGLSANPNTGIVINEVDQSGAPVPGQTYDYNSCRIPWRATLDYLWYGTAAVKDAMTKLTTFAIGVGIDKVVDGYKADGTPTGQYTGLNAFVGGFAVGAMTDTAAVADTFGTYFAKIADDNGGYYGASLRTLYLLALSGNQWNPAESGDAGSPTGPGKPSSDAGKPGKRDAGVVVSTDGGPAARPPKSGNAGTGGGHAQSDASVTNANGSGDSSGGCGCRITPIGESFGLTRAFALALGLLARGAARRRRTRGREALGQ